MEILSKIGVLTKETEAETKDVRFQGVYMCWMDLSDCRPLASLLKFSDVLGDIL